jgi:hypothetical protein
MPGFPLILLRNEDFLLKPGLLVFKEYHDCHRLTTGTRISHFSSESSMTSWTFERKHGLPEDTNTFYILRGTKGVLVFFRGNRNKAFLLFFKGYQQFPVVS